MSKLIGLFLATSLVAVTSIKAQIDTSVISPSSTTDSVVLSSGHSKPLVSTENVKREKKYDLSRRANDHLMMQLGYLAWTGGNAAALETPANAFNREFNISFMYDKPFKANPHYSVGLGLGYSVGNVFFNKVSLGLKEPLGTDGKLKFTDVSNAKYFDSYKMVTQYVEAPLELRYAASPEQPAKGFRVALGLKVGYLLSVNTRGKNLMQVPVSGGDATSVYGKNYIQKEYAGGQYMNSTRFTGTLRIGYHVANIFATYQLNTLFAPDRTVGQIRPITVGIGLGVL